MTTQIENARITTTTLGIEDHGMFTYYVGLEMESLSVSFGGYILGGEFTTQAIKRLLETVGVEKWEDLPGKHVRVEHEGWGGKALKLGHIINNSKWLDLDALSKEFAFHA
jgi:hypothetical protein